MDLVDRKSTADAKRSIVSLIKDILLGAAIISGAIYLLIAIGSTQAPTRAPENSASGPSLSIASGTEAQLNNGNPTIPVALDEDILSQMVAAGNDLSRVPSIGGRLFYVTENAPVRIVEANAVAVRIRILAGNQKGRLGWVPIAWLKAR
jgi:hypothetical protein